MATYLSAVILLQSPAATISKAPTEMCKIVTLSAKSSLIIGENPRIRLVFAERVTNHEKMESIYDTTLSELIYFFVSVTSKTEQVVYSSALEPFFSGFEK